MAGTSPAMTLRIGRMLADINAGRQHISNQFEQVGRAWAAAMLGGEPGKDLML
jgi:hypothetical protein